MKTCTKCDKTFELSEFLKNTKSGVAKESVVILKRAINYLKEFNNGKS